jgi:hypothetical protein
MSETANTQPTEIKRRKRRVSPKVVQALEYLASGRARTQTEAATMASISPEWLSKMLKRPEIGVMIDEMCRRFLRAGKVRATSRLLELLESNSSRTSLEASRLVLGIGGIAPPRDGVTVNVGNVGYVVHLQRQGNDDVVSEIGECGGVIYDRPKSTSAPASAPPTIDLIPDPPEDER